MNSTNITFSLLEKIEKANEDFSLFDGAQKILVALSGGADSTSLLLLLKELSEKYGFSLFALHVNHMIRGEEADRDEEFSRRLCQDNEIPFFCEHIDVPLLSKKRGQSLELCARNERYDAFERVCRENAITHVATAHNACDNAETVLFNLVRGSGTRGLCGIPPKRSLCDGICVIRPLVFVERSEIEEYLRDKNQAFVTDSTNKDDEYTRNYIRNDVMPLLKRINPSLERSLLRTSELVSKDEEYLSMLSENNFSDDLQNLGKLPYPLLSRVIMDSFSRISKQPLSVVHVKRLCGKIYEYDTGKTRVSFPDGYFAKLQGGKLSFEKDRRTKKGEKSFFSKELCPGENFFEESIYALYITNDKNKDIPQTIGNGGNVYKLYNTDYLNSAKIQLSLLAKSRSGGEKILCCGMHKSLKRLLCASGLDGEMRSMLPMIWHGDDLALVPSVSVSDLFRCSGETNRISVSLYIKDNTIWE